MGFPLLLFSTAAVEAALPAPLPPEAPCLQPAEFAQVLGWPRSPMSVRGDTPCGGWGGGPLRLRGTRRRGCRLAGLAKPCRTGDSPPAGIHGQEGEDPAAGLRVEGKGGTLRERRTYPGYGRWPGPIPSRSWGSSGGISAARGFLPGWRGEAGSDEAAGEGLRTQLPRHSRRTTRQIAAPVQGIQCWPAARRPKSGASAPKQSSKRRAGPA